MSHHRIVVDIELTDNGKQDKMETLMAIAGGIARNATEDYGITEYEDGVPMGDGGFDGPFVTSVKTQVLETSTKGTALK